MSAVQSDSVVGSDLDGWTQKERKNWRHDAETLKNRDVRGSRQIRKNKEKHHTHICGNNISAYSGGLGDGGEAVGDPDRSAEILQECRRPCCCLSTRLNHKKTKLVYSGTIFFVTVRFYEI